MPRTDAKRELTLSQDRRRLICVRGGPVWHKGGSHAHCFASRHLGGHRVCGPGSYCTRSSSSSPRQPPKPGWRGSPLPTPTAATSSKSRSPPRSITNRAGATPAHELTQGRGGSSRSRSQQKHDRTTTTSPRQNKQPSSDRLNGGMTMNVVCRRIRLGGSAVAALGAFLLVLLQVTAAHAATPDHFKFTETESFTDTTTCGFPIALNFQSKHVGTVFFDAQGNFQRAIVETNAVGTNSANGITLRETDHVRGLLQFSRIRQRGRASYPHSGRRGSNSGRGLHLVQP